MRYFIEISYLGTGYHGWQIQPNAITIQEVLENCMSKILNSKIKLIGAGRTDSGVHANQMFAHFDFNSKIINSKELIYKLNSFLPKKIVINDLIMVKNCILYKSPRTRDSCAARLPATCCEKKGG